MYDKGRAQSDAVIDAPWDAPTRMKMMVQLEARSASGCGGERGEAPPFERDRPAPWFQKRRRAAALQGASRCIFGAGIGFGDGYRDVRGFTLLEVALVVILMAVVLAVTYPSLSRGSSALRLRTTGRDVVNAMRTAREKAVTEQKEMHVVADREAQKILMTDELGDGARVYSLPHGIRMARMFLAGHEVVDGPMVIRFLSNGSCENAEIILVSDKGSALRVSADPITGAARIVPVSGAEQQ